MIDLAAGTGRLTQELLALGASVTAVEPLDEMRALIQGTAAVKGTAEDIPVSDGSADAVFVAEAFHWFDAPAALREIARVLRPGGGLALMWNVALPDEAPWRQEVAELVAPVYKHPQGRRVPAAGDTQWQGGEGWEAFESLEHLEFEHGARLSRDQYVALVSSWSFVGALKEDEQTELLSAVAAVLERHGVAEFDQRWRTDLHLFRRCPA